MYITNLFDFFVLQCLELYPYFFAQLHIFSFGQGGIMQNIYIANTLCFQITL